METLERLESKTKVNFPRISQNSFKINVVVKDLERLNLSFKILHDRARLDVFCKDISTSASVFDQERN